jgi:hypothetical protein
MELGESGVWGSFYGITDPDTGEKRMFLFYCKAHAVAAMAEGELDARRWAVRGLPRYALRAFLIQLEFFEMKGVSASILYKPPGAEAEKPFIAIPAERAALVAEYYGKDIPSIRTGVQ